MPVSVPVNVNTGHYGDGTVSLSLHAHASPGHSSVMGHPGSSPRPASSSGMLDVGGNNGFAPNNPSPIPDSPPPSSSSQQQHQQHQQQQHNQQQQHQQGVLKQTSSQIVRPLSPQQPPHSLVGSHIQRPSLRVVIPGPRAGLAISNHDRGERSSDA